MFGIQKKSKRRFFRGEGDPEHQRLGHLQISRGKLAGGWGGGGGGGGGG